MEGGETVCVFGVQLVPLSNKLRHYLRRWGLSARVVGSELHVPTKTRLATQLATAADSF